MKVVESLYRARKQGCSNGTIVKGKDRFAPPMAYEIPLRSLQHICTAKLLVLHNLLLATDLTNKHKQRREVGLTLGTTQHDGILSPVQLDLNASNEDTSAAGRHR
jgi:hypothetical protein